MRTLLTVFMVFYSSLLHASGFDPASIALSCRSTGVADLIITPVLIIVMSIMFGISPTGPSFIKFGAIVTPALFWIPVGSKFRRPLLFTIIGWFSCTVIALIWTSGFLKYQACGTYPEGIMSIFQDGFIVLTASNLFIMNLVLAAYLWLKATCLKSWKSFLSAMLLAIFIGLVICIFENLILIRGKTLMAKYPDQLPIQTLELQ